FVHGGRPEQQAIETTRRHQRGGKCDPSQHYSISGPRGARNITSKSCESSPTIPVSPYYPINRRERRETQRSKETRSSRKVMTCLLRVTPRPLRFVLLQLFPYS